MSEQVNISPTENKYLIKKDGVDIFLIGEQIPTLIDGYGIIKGIEIKTEEGEDFEMLVHTVFEKGEEMLHIERLLLPEIDTDDIIYDIFIVSDKFKTTKNIGVNSTIDEFITVYPDFLIWFSYIDGKYVIETKEFEGIQFFLEGSDFIDESGPAFDSDMTILRPSKFKEGTKIRRIRIW